MNRKFKMFTALIACIFVQLVNGTNVTVTECFSCDTPKTCQIATIQTCNEESANITRDHLKLFFSNISYVTSTQFECLKASYQYKNSTVMSISGCIYSGVNPCFYKPLGTAWISETCKNCTTNLCNQPDSPSLSSTIIISITCISFIIIKMLVM